MFFACVSDKWTNRKKIVEYCPKSTSLNGRCNSASCRQHACCVGRYLLQLCFQRYREPRLVHMLRQGGQQFTELRVLCQILLFNVTQRHGGENCDEKRLQCQ